MYQLKTSLLPKLILVLLLFVWTIYSKAQTWQALNPPLNLFNGSIFATTIDKSGHIYAGGNFRNSNNSNFVAIWSGSDWIELGNGTNGLNANSAILTMTNYNDTLYAAGAFSNKSGQFYVAKWNGNAWSELDKNASLHANGIIYAITVDKAGNVYAAGSFTNASSKYYVAKWNGNTWTELGAGSNALNANGFIYALTCDASGNVYAGGYFTNTNSKKYVARWNGSSWSELGAGTNSLNANDYINCLAVDANGNVYSGGAFTNSSGECYLAKWAGNGWTEVGVASNALHANGPIKTIAIKNETEIYVAGQFTNYSNYYVARFNGTVWAEVTTPQNQLQTNDRIESISIDATSNIYAGGKFLNKSGHSFIAKWSGAGWEELGAKGDPFYSQGINQIVADSSGNVYATDKVYIQNNGNTFFIKNWNGKSWKELSLPDSLGLFIAGAHSMVIDHSGNLNVTGRKRVGTIFYDCVLNWDGAKWKVLEDFSNSLGAVNTNPAYGISEIELDRQGNIYVLGSFSDANFGTCSLAKWDGKTWQRLRGSGAGYIKNFCVTGDGNIYAFGDYSDEIGRGIIVSYHPTKQMYWAEVKGTNSRFGFPGLNIFSALVTDDQNNLYVNGNFTNAAGNRYIGKWDGNTWSELGATPSLGLDLAIDKHNTIYTNSPIKKWNGTTWGVVGAPLATDPFNFPGSLLAIDPAGNIYSNANLPTPGSTIYIVKFSAVPLTPPKINSFNPTKGSKGMSVTITGKNFTGTSTVSFGGIKAASFTVKNDSTITAIVGSGSTGSVKIRTSSGEDSLQTFTYTCDSVKGPIPTLFLFRDSLLISSQANYYQWYFNSNKMPDAVLDRITIKDAGFYHVETSEEGLCWIPSLDYPVLLGRGSTPDSLQLFIYPNPSTGNSIAYVRLPQVSTTMAYVQVFDASGVIVFQSSKLIFYGNEIRIPISISSKGTFFVRMNVNDKTVQQTLIVM